MACCHHYALHEGCDEAFAVDTSAIVFGRNALREAGEHARALGLKRVAVFTDPGIIAAGHTATVLESLKAAGVEAVVYDAVKVEPTDVSFMDAVRFAVEARPDGYLSIGGGSVIDTAKAANLYATYPADLLTYVNKPVGAGEPPPGPLKPHIACPTTCGTGSECTGMAIFDYLALHAKTGIAHKLLRPTLALIDPATTASLPSMVVAASGFDVLSHALESYTARPYTRRPLGGSRIARPLSQGANPWSDMGCREALRLIGIYLERAVNDAADVEAREQMMWAATLAGIAFGNSGVHAPHGMAYSVAGLVRDYRPAGYPQGEAIVPHGMSVILNAPAVFRWTADSAPDRHIEAAGLLGGDTRGAGAPEAGDVIAPELIRLMKATAMPNGLSGVGYGAGDVNPLTDGAMPQQRLLANAPKAIDRAILSDLYAGAMSYW